ncbi:unnamed protein product, partial [Rotaria sp. Silwood1]
KPYLEEFPKVHTNSKSTRSIILIVPSKFLVEKSTKKQEKNIDIQEDESKSIDDNNKSSTTKNIKKSI